MADDRAGVYISCELAGTEQHNIGFDCRSSVREVIELIFDSIRGQTIRTRRVGARLKVGADEVEGAVDDELPSGFIAEVFAASIVCAGSRIEIDPSYFLCIVEPLFSGLRYHALDQSVAADLDDSVETDQNDDEPE